MKFICDWVRWGKPHASDLPAPRGDLEKAPMADVLPFSKVRRSMTMQRKSWAKPLISRASPFMTTGNPI